MANIIKIFVRVSYSRSDNNSSESSVPLADWVEPPNTTEEEPIVPLAPLPNMSDVPPITSATPTATTPGTAAVANGATATPTATATTTVAKARTSDDNNIFSVLYSVGKKVAIVGSIYLVGYMGWSVAWLIAPVILSVARDQMAKTSEKKRDIAKSSALANEKDVILARIDELPAWVYFPDVERAEWLNKVRTGKYNKLQACFTVSHSLSDCSNRSLSKSGPTQIILPAPSSRKPSSLMWHWPYRSTR